MSKPSVILTAAATTAGIAAAGWYALAVPAAPQPTAANSTGNTPRQPDRAAMGPTPIDRAAFDIVLWRDPPPPPQPPPQQPTKPARTVPPPQIDLLAITNAGDGYGAIFYDKGNDRLVTLRSGDTLGPYRVAAIDQTRVRFETGRGSPITMELGQPRIRTQHRVSPEQTDE